MSALLKSHLWLYKAFLFILEICYMYISPLIIQTWQKLLMRDSILTITKTITDFFFNLTDCLDFVFYIADSWEFFSSYFIQPMTDFFYI